MKLAVALILAFVAQTAAFVALTPRRSVIAASRTPSTYPLQAEDNKEASSEAAATDSRDGQQAKGGDESEPRRAFSAAPTFEEFLKFKQAERGETELKIP
eukprot:g18004.t1